jgi:hypothetical protein
MFVCLFALGQRELLSRYDETIRQPARSREMIEISHLTFFLEKGIY